MGSDSNGSDSRMKATAFWWAIGLWDGNKVIDPPVWLRNVIGYSLLGLNFHAYIRAWEVWVKPRVMKGQEE